MKKIISIIVALVLLATAVVMVGCSEESDSYKEDRKIQEDIMQKAQAAVPIYETQNYLSRLAINEYMKRMDTPDKLWYIYPMTESGAYIGYYISRTYPISIAVAMSNPLQKLSGNNGNVVVPAPGIDGVYYNGVDPSLYYFFDASTDAMVLLTTDFVALDYPLDVDAPVLNIKD